jgi:hypothetical protein
MKGHENPDYNFNIRGKINLIFDGIEFKEK